MANDDNETFKLIKVENVKGVTQCKIQSSPELVNAGAKGWNAKIFSEQEMDFYIYDIDADAETFPLHTADDNWVIYIMEGLGELLLGDDDFNLQSSTKYQQGDIISIDSKLIRGWKNGPQQSKIIFVKLAKGQ
jgi:hypothetical protein